MKHIGRLDTSHAMYQPAKRAKSCGLSAYERRITKVARKTISTFEYGTVVPSPNGSREQKEAWMRDRQRQAQLGREREKLRMPHPPKEIQQRWIDEGEVEC
jgi:hypothetical protein